MIMIKKATLLFLLLFLPFVVQSQQLLGGMIEIDIAANTITFTAPTVRSVNSGITASTSQSQGNGALTATFNQISTVANANDVVTLITALKGIAQEIANDGANDLQIFPASGDDLGAGLNLSTSLEPGESIVFIAFDNTNWNFASVSQISHGEMQDTDNTDAYVINGQNKLHVYHSNGLLAGDLSSGWSFDPGGAGTSFPIASIADAGSGDILVTTTGSHTLAVGAIVSQSNLTDAAYEGVFVVKTVPLVTTYTATATFTATGTGTMDEAATLTASALAAGTYLINYSYSTTTASNNETIDFDIFLNTISQGGGLAIREKFGTGADFSSGTGTGLIDIVSGDKLSLCVLNTDSAGNITIRNFGLVPIKL